MMCGKKVEKVTDSYVLINKLLINTTMNTEDIDNAITLSNDGIYYINIVYMNDINKFQQMLHNLNERGLLNNEQIRQTILREIWREKNYGGRDLQVILQMIKILLEDYQFDVHSNDNSLLSRALYYSAEHIIKYLINVQQVNPHIMLDNPYYMKILVSNCRIDIFKLMIEHGIDINKICANGVFRESIYTKMTKCSIFFLENGYQYDNEDFLYAVIFNNLSIVKMMLESGNVNIHYQNDEALRNSIIFRHIDMIELLFRHGAEVKPVEINKDYAKLYDLLKSQNLAEKEIFDLLVLSTDNINKN